MFALVELVDSSLAKDVGPKRQLYARFGISDYLVVDLEADEVEHRSDPSGDRYFRSTRLARGATFTLRSLQGVALESTPFLAPE